MLPKKDAAFLWLGHLSNPCQIGTITAFLSVKEGALQDSKEEWQGYDFKERFEKTDFSLGV